MFELILAFLLSGHAQAATPKHPTAAVKSSATVLKEATADALGLPLGNRLQAISDQGPQGYRNLVTLMFDGSQSMELRWRATTAAGRIGGAESKPELVKAMQRPEWFMRNAALIALVNVDRQAAIQWSRELLSDKALVVRAAAVDAIESMGDNASAPLLWRKLRSAENFRNGQSLFVRRRMVEALGKIEKPGAEARFIELLAENEPGLHAPAVAALERMTTQKLGGEKDPLNFKRDRWQKWWKAQARSKSTPQES